MFKTTLALAATLSLAFAAPAFARYEVGPVTIKSLTQTASAAIDFPMGVTIASLHGLSRDEVQARFPDLTQSELDLVMRQVRDGQVRNHFVAADH